MSPLLMLGLVAAVILFWAVGAYNRLVRLRAAATEAFVTLERTLRLHLTLVQSGLTPREAEGSPLLAGMLGAAGQFDSALKAARQQPLDDLVVRALVTAREALDEAWARLRSAPPDLAGELLPEPLQQQWHHIAGQTQDAREEFNRRVQDYNDAIDMFPARLLAGLFRFRHAHPL